MPLRLSRRAKTPRPAPNLHEEASPPLSMPASESGPPHGRRTRASRRSAPKNSNTHASRTRTDARTSAGDRTAPHTAQDPAHTADRLAELCGECECYLCPEEKEANERPATATARRGRCDDCYRTSPAPIAPIFSYTGRSRAVLPAMSTPSPPPLNHLPPLRGKFTTPPAAANTYPLPRAKTRPAAPAGLYEAFRLLR